MKKLLSLILTIVMLVGIIPALPLSVSAETDGSIDYTGKIPVRGDDISVGTHHNSGTKTDTPFGGFTLNAQTGDFSYYIWDDAISEKLEEGKEVLISFNAVVPQDNEGGDVCFGYMENNNYNDRWAFYTFEPGTSSLVDIALIPGGDYTKYIVMIGNEQVATGTMEITNSDTWNYCWYSYFAANKDTSITVTSLDITEITEWAPLRHTETVPAPRVSVESGVVPYGTVVRISPVEGHFSYYINEEFYYSYDFYEEITICEDTVLRVVSWKDVMDPNVTYIGSEATYTYTVDPATIPSGDATEEPTEVPATEVPTYAPDSFYDLFTWGLSNEEITILGFDPSYEGALTIPSTHAGYPVTRIGAGAFKNCSSLTSVTVPSSVTFISYEAFAGCEALESIDLPDGINFIGADAFNGTALTRISVPANMTIIFSAAFRGCQDLTFVSISERVTEIREDAFADCPALTDVGYSDTEYKWNMIDIRDGNDALLNATLHPIVIEHPQGPSESVAAPIVSPASCEFDDSIDVTLSCETPGANIYYSYSFPNQDIEVPAVMWLYTEPIHFTYTTVLSAYAEKGGVMSDWVSVTFTNRNEFSTEPPTTEEPTAEPTMPPFTATIDETSKIIVVTEVGIARFDGKPGYYVQGIQGGEMVELSICNEMEEYHGVDVLTLDKGDVIMVATGVEYVTNLVLKVDNTSIAAMQNFADYNGEEDVIEELIRQVDGKYSNELTFTEEFESENGVYGKATSLILGGTSADYTLVSDLSPNTAVRVSSYSEINPIRYDYVLYIRKVNDIFVDVVIYEYMKGDSPLAEPTAEPTEEPDIESLFTYEVADGKATITDFNSSYEGAVIIPSTLGGYPVTQIGDRAFEECRGITSVIIPESVTSIGESAFNFCASLTSVTLPQTLTTIEASTFSFCGSLTSIEIPNTVTSIGESAFACCFALTSVNIPESVTSLGLGAFFSCYALPAITIPSGVTSIPNEVFCQCIELATVNLPNTITNIGRDAFSTCSALTDVYYGGDETDWENITINDGNDDLGNATIHFSTSNPTEPPVTEEPTDVPTDAPTEVPTEAPTEAPTEVPTTTPTEEPTGELTVSKSSVSVKVGNSVSVSAYLGDVDITDSATWNSKKDSIATVENGTITGEKAGYTTVSVSYGDQIKQIQVEVKTSGGGGSTGGGGIVRPTTVPTAAPTSAPTQAPIEGTMPFGDVSESDWYFDAVSFAYESGLMNGVAEDEFSPDSTITRAMFVTVLYRLAGEPEVTGTLPFTDVPAGSYYEKAVLWAIQNSIVSGTNETTFSPDAEITREQMATMIYRYALLHGASSNGTSSLNFADSDDISSYAREALAWCTENGIILGMDDNMLYPQATATRAQAATIFMRIANAL